MEHSEITKLRKKVEGLRGLRKAIAEAELAERLVKVESGEALTLAQSACERARALVAGAVERNARQEPYLDALAHALRAQAQVLKNMQRYGEAEMLFLECIDLYDRLDKVPELVGCHILLHNLCRNLGQFQRALELLDRAIMISGQNGFDGDDAALHGERGTILGHLGRNEEARAAFELGLEIAVERNDYFYQIILCGNFASFYLHTDNHANAEKRLRQALDLDTKFNVLDAADRVALIWNFTRVMRLSGNFAALLELLEQGIESASAAKLALDHALFIMYKAHILIFCGDYAPAYHYLQKIPTLDVFESNEIVAARYWSLAALLLSAVRDENSAGHAAQRAMHELEGIQTDSPRQRFELLSILGVLGYVDCKEFDIAAYRPMYDQGIRDSDNSTFRAQRAGLHIGLGILLEKAGERQAAYAEYTAAVELSRQWNWLPTLANGLMGLGRLDNVHGDISLAIQCLNEALDIAKSIGARQWQIRAHHELARVYEQAGKDSDALRHLQAGQALERETLAPHIIYPIWRGQREAEQNILRGEHQRNQDELASEKEQNASLQRILQAKTTQIVHLADTLAELEKSLERNSGEDVAAFHQRLAQQRTKIQHILDSGSWREFEQEVGNQDDDYLVRLARDYPNLTATERKICSLIRLNNTTKDLCQLLNISPRSVQSYRYRIRKKLAIPSETDFNTYITSL